MVATLQLKTRVERPPHCDRSAGVPRNRMHGTCSTVTVRELPTREPRISCTTKTDFIASVIYDGRFIDNFTKDPDSIAALLGTTLLPHISDEIRGRSGTELLIEATDQLKHRIAWEALQRNTEEDDALPCMDGGISFIVGGIIVWAVIDRCASKCESTVTVEDYSPNADQKL